MIFELVKRLGRAPISPKSRPQDPTGMRMFGWFHCMPHLSQTVLAVMITRMLRSDNADLHIIPLGRENARLMNLVFVPQVVVGWR